MTPAIPRLHQFEKPTEMYGLVYPKGALSIAPELQGYRENRGPDVGGLGKEAHFRNAFRIMWPNFIWHDWMELLVSAWCLERFVTVIGHSRATKTYGTAHCAYLDYCAAPQATWTSMTTTSFDGLRSRGWSDLMMAIETATLPCPFKRTSSSNEMKVRIGDKEKKGDDRYQIEGFATAPGSEARIQGKHADRRRLILDEAQGLPDAIWTAEVNAATAPDFISARLANPVDKMSKFGRECCEPEGGWSTVTADDLVWRAKGGRLVLHFDGLQCHNYKLWQALQRGAIDRAQYEKKKLIFMLQPEYVEEVRKVQGEDSIEWWMYVRGMFPPDGLVARVFPDAFLERMREPIVFDFPPVKCAALDPAYEHDDCVLVLFEVGQMRGGKTAVNFVRNVVIKPKVKVGGETKDEQIAAEVKRVCEEEGVAAENFVQDTSGNGRSVFSHLSRNWSRAIVGVEFGGAPTDRRFDDADEKRCNKMFFYFVDELLFRAAEWARLGVFGGLANLDERTKIDLGSRLYSVKDQKRRVEKKAEVKKRIGRSPDFGDAFILAAELLARRGIFPGGSGRMRDGDGSGVWAGAREKAKRACKVFNPDCES